jgi:hypothetical protein
MPQTLLFRRQEFLTVQRHHLEPGHFHWQFHGSGHRILIDAQDYRHQEEPLQRLRILSLRQAQVILERMLSQYACSGWEEIQVSQQRLFAPGSRTRTSWALILTLQDLTLDLSDACLTPPKEWLQLAKIFPLLRRAPQVPLTEVAPLRLSGRWLPLILEHFPQFSPELAKTFAREFPSRLFRQLHLVEPLKLSGGHHTPVYRSQGLLVDAQGRWILARQAKGLWCRVLLENCSFQFCPGPSERFFWHGLIYHSPPLAVFPRFSR